mgnify:CR=1 FL=1
MAVLEKNYLLYFLISCFIVFAQVEKQDLKFFDKSVKFFDFGEGCQECEEETQPTKPTSQTKPVSTKYQIILFISLQDDLTTNKKVVNEIKRFVNMNPEFEVKGYLIDKIENFKDLAFKNYELFDNTFEFDFDPLLRSKRKKYKICPYLFGIG